MYVGSCKCIRTICVDVDSYPFPVVGVWGSAIISALCAEVSVGRDWAQITSVSVVTATPALLCPSQMKLLPSVNQVSSAPGKGESLRSGLVLCTCAKISLYWRSG